MKKVVERKLYNTETAEEIASWSNGYYGSDFRRCEESLYRTSKGAYFIAGSGGPCSKYAVPTGNGFAGGSDLFPVSKERAYEWLEETGNIEAIEEHFIDEIEEA